jgi:hypothetical protein
MFTIHVLLKTLPGGYGPILGTYNANRPAGSQPIYKAGVCEGGFEIPLNAQERDQLEQRAKQLDRRLDPNDYVRQLRWNKGKLQSGFYAGFTEAEVSLLYAALVAVFGAENVKAIQYEN